MPRKNKPSPSDPGGSRDASGQQGQGAGGGVTKKKKQQPQKDDGPEELEEHYILRLPQEQAAVLREALRSGLGSGKASVRNRLKIQMEQDMRHAKVFLDGQMLHGKVLDLPTHVETLKTTDNKSFYKTADVSQMLVCTEEEEEDPATPDPKVTTDTAKKDPRKVDKKFLLPHGITPPMKNVRKRRFRRTLKRKVQDPPDIQKEVQNLLRMDQEAVHVRWEILDEEEVMTGAVGGKASNKGEGEMDESSCIDESDIFGEILSESLEGSQISPMSMQMLLDDSSSTGGDSQTSTSSYIASLMELQMKVKEKKKPRVKRMVTYEKPSCSMGDAGASGGEESPIPSTSTASKDTEEIMARLRVLRQEISELRVRRTVLEDEIEGMTNVPLRKRFKRNLKSIIKELEQKEQKREELLAMIQLSTQLENMFLDKY